LDMVRSVLGSGVAIQAIGKIYLHRVKRIKILFKFLPNRAEYAP